MASPMNRSFGGIANARKGPLTKAAPKVSELAIHRAIVDMLRKTARAGVIYWHTPNGELRDAATAGKLKAMGVLPGVSDLLMMDGRCFYAMEVKKPGERPTLAQSEFLEWFKETGGKTAVVSSASEAEFYFMQWNITKIATVRR